MQQIYQSRSLVLTRLHQYSSGQEFIDVQRPKLYVRRVKTANDQSKREFNDLE
jgi:hypothetical protein